jgi:Transposase
MKQARFTEERIIGVLREREAGVKTADLTPKHGFSEATLYNWNAKFGGMDVSEAKRLRQLGEPPGLNRIYRLYREEDLTARKRRARRRAVGTRAPILVEARPNARWSLDFVHDQFANRRRDPGMPGGDRRYLNLRPADGARTGGTD